jgi:uncharacterized protein (DUF2141 family)
MLRFHTLAVSLVMVAIGGAAAAQEACEGKPTGTRLDIIVEGVRTDRGLMTATLYPPESRKFLKASGEIAVWRVPAKAPATPMCVWLPSPGAYAVVIYDDLNANRRFDHTLVAPLEPYGFSNDPHPFMILPSAASARFTVGPEGATIHIHLRYPAGVGGDAKP